jgi:general secretion pathway protein G
MILPASSSSRSRNRGFTLLEIMVVLAILGLLVAVLVRNVGGDLDRGQEQAAGLFVKTTLTSPLTGFRIDTGNYPTTAQGLERSLRGETADGSMATALRIPFPRHKKQK